MMLPSLLTWMLFVTTCRRLEWSPVLCSVSLQAIPSFKASYGAVIIPDTKSSKSEDFEYPHTMNPATMDAVFYFLLAGFNDDRPIDEDAVLYGISDMFVAADQPLEAATSFLEWSIDIQE